MSKDKCNHRTLCFGSGGFFVFCQDCPSTWTATKSDGELDSERGKDSSLSWSDKRVDPNEQPPKPQLPPVRVIREDEAKPRQ